MVYSIRTTNALKSQSLWNFRCCLETWGCFICSIFVIEVSLLIPIYLSEKNHINKHIWNTIFWLIFINYKFWAEIRIKFTHEHNVWSINYIENSPRQISIKYKSTSLDLPQVARVTHNVKYSSMLVFVWWFQLWNWCRLYISGRIYTISDNRKVHVVDLSGWGTSSNRR